MAGTHRRIQKVNVKEGEEGYKNTVHIACEICQQLLDWLNTNDLFEIFETFISCIGVREVSDGSTAKPTDNCDEANTNNKSRTIPW